MYGKSSTAGSSGFGDGSGGSLQLAAAEEERVEEGAVGELRPVRLHHERRVEAEPVERVGGADERQRQQGAPPEQDPEAPLLEQAVGADRSLSRTSATSAGLGAIDAVLANAMQLERPAGAGHRAVRERDRPHRARGRPSRRTKSAPSPRARTTNGTGCSPRTSTRSAGTSGRGSASTSSVSGRYSDGSRSRSDSNLPNRNHRLLAHGDLDAAQREPLERRQRVRVAVGHEQLRQPRLERERERDDVRERLVAPSSPASSCRAAAVAASSCPKRDASSRRRRRLRSRRSGP